jgi:hypothetical protein
LARRSEFRCAFGEADPDQVTAILRLRGLDSASQELLERAIAVAQMAGASSLLDANVELANAVLALCAGSHIQRGWFRGLYGTISLLVQPSALGAEKDFDVPNPPSEFTERFLLRLDSLTEPDLQNVAWLTEWHELSGYETPEMVMQVVDRVMPSHGDYPVRLAEVADDVRGRFASGQTVLKLLAKRVGRDEFWAAAQYATQFADQEAALSRAILRAGAGLMAVEFLSSRDFAGLYLPFAVAIPSRTLLDPAGT